MSAQRRIKEKEKQEQARRTESNRVCFPVQKEINDTQFKHLRLVKIIMPLNTDFL